MKNPGFALAAVVDPVTERLAEARSEFGVEHCFADCAALLAGNVHIDLAVISSPTRFHREQTVQLLGAGIDVFCDKPAALCCADAAAMQMAAEHYGRKLMVFQPHRLTGEALTMRKIIADGKLGKIFMMHRSSNNYSRRNDWQAFAGQGGGMLFNYGAHYIDQLFYLAGGDICRSAKCELSRELSLGDADDVAELLLRGASGMLYRLDINMATALNMPNLALYGKFGTAMKISADRWRIRYLRPEELPEIAINAAPAAPNRQYPSEKLHFYEEEFAEIPEDLDEYYRRCYAYYADGAEPFVPMAETVEVMRTLEMCRENSVED